MLIGASILHPVVLYYERDLYMDILGRSFYSDHPILFLLLDGFHKYIIFGSVYALFFAAVRQHVQRGLILLLSGLHDCTGRTLLHQHHTSAGSAFAAASVFHCDVYLGTEPEKKAW